MNGGAEPLHLAPVTTADDIETCTDIFFEAANELHRRKHVPEEDPAEGWWLTEALDHLVRTDPDGTVLASRGGAPVAFASAYRREAFWFLSFLFVRPGAQSEGVGSELLAHLLPSEPDRRASTLATTIEAFQPVSAALYARFGMVPRTPKYRLKGLQRTPGLPPAVTAVPLGPGHADERDALDREVLGYARPQDHAFWAKISQVKMAYVDDTGSLVGYGYAADHDGWTGPVCSRSPKLTARIAADVFVRLAEPRNGQVSVTGSSPAFRLLLDAGMHIDETEEAFPFIYCSTVDPPASYLSFSGYLL